MEDKKKIGRSKEDILKEIKRLSDLGEKDTSKQIELFGIQDLGDEDIDLGIGKKLLNDTANPKRSYQLYYAIRRLLIEYLPKGAEHKKLRGTIYEEKNIFLTAGHTIDEQGIRGADSRQAYIPNFLEVAFRLVTEWVSSGANSFDIWQSFYDLNEERGYHNPNPSNPLSDFNKKLLAAIDNKPQK
jgi:hypothetical protein